MEQASLPLTDKDNIEYEFPCLRATQPIGDIYVATISSKILRKISYFDVRRVLTEDRDIERYLGIQRPLDLRRVEQLSSYVNYKDASFPTSIILSVPEEYVSYDESKNRMTVRNFVVGENRPSVAISQIAKVLDGQHRIAGLEKFSGNTFDLTVTLFVGADIADQAQIFATVNLEQTKVNKSLVYDLYALASARSPQKTCHNIALAFDKDEKSPLYGRIKRLGIATVGRVFEPITQATFVEAIIPLISQDPKSDRDKLLRNTKIQKLYGDDLFKVPLRNIFVDGEDVKIAEILMNFLQAAKERWPVAWEDRGRGATLNRTNGFKALMKTFRVAYTKLGAPGDVVTTQKFIERWFAPISLTDTDFTVENFAPGTSGEARMTRIFLGREKL